MASKSTWTTYYEQNKIFVDAQTIHVDNKYVQCGDRWEKIAKAVGEGKSVEDVIKETLKLRNGLLKKAYELSVLPVAEVALIVFSSLYEYAIKRLARSKPMEARLASIIAVVVTTFALLVPAASTHTTRLSASGGNNQSQLVVGFTYIQGAAAKGAVCLDGTLSGYHFHPGFGAGANSWLVDFEGGGWCNDIKSCVNRKFSRLGSSKRMKKPYKFVGILSNKAQQNPDFFNWNKVHVRYCDGASFAGDGEYKTAGLQFRGQRIYAAAMEDLMAKGMRHADQALLSGGSAGGVAVLLHCDAFSNLFSRTTRVKCLSDGGLFMDTVDVSGGHSMRSRVYGVVSLQGVQSILPGSCTSRHDPVFCFFPQNLINYVKTPLFILNAAYDTAQIQAGIAPNVSDPEGKWNACKLNFANCSSSQIKIFQKFRNEMVKAVQGFGPKRQNGLFINSCFAHTQSDKQVTWLSKKPPMIDNKEISRSVGD